MTRIAGASPAVLVLVAVAIHAAGGSMDVAGAEDTTHQAVAHEPVDGQNLREIRIAPLRRPDTASLVRRHLASREGEPFERAKLQDDYRQLDALRLFSNIELEPVADAGEVVLLVRLTETLRLLPLLAISVTDENGVSAGPGFKGINLFGDGALSSGTLAFGGATAVDLSMERPTVTPRRWALAAGVSYGVRRNELFGFEERSTTIAARAGWNRSSRVQIGGGGEFLRIDTGGAAVALSPDGSDHLPAAGVFFTYNSLDALSNPRDGWLAAVDVGHRFGDASFWTLTLDGRRLQPLAHRSILSLGVLGVWQSGVVSRDVPEYMQFGVGGANSVRGWSLGSRVGKNQAIATVEYLYSLVPVRPFTVFGLNVYGGVQAAVFSDVGLAWTGPFRASEAIDGYGVGLRLLMPFIDVVRMDFAFGQPGRGVAMSFGLYLKADKQRDRVR